jgi:phage repressor protein C with HTH and peptisase S24 domain
MARFDDDGAIDVLMSAVGRESESADENLIYQDERFLFWLANDLRSGLDHDQRSRDQREAIDFARRTLTRLKVRLAEKRLPRRQLKERAASIRATLAHSVPAASRERCATILDLAVAAGAGRELWDEPCDRWLELPEDLPSARYVALRVAGDSMAPVLGPREVILIQLDAAPRVDDLIVARLPDQSHVVKRVASMSGRTMELASFNPEYESIFVARDPSPVVGTVIARFTRE